MNSLKFKILAIVIFPLLIVALILTASHISNRMSDAEYRLTSKVKTMTRILANSLEYGIISGNDAYTKSLLSDFAESNEIIRANLYNNEGKTIGSITDEKYDATLDSDKLYIETGIFRSTESIDDFSSEDIDYKNEVGTLRVTVSTQELEKEKNAIIFEGIIITLLLVLITLIVTLAFIKRITRPFMKILNGIDIIRKGNVGYQLESSTIKELDSLTRNINAMSTSLKAAQDELVNKSDNALYVERSKALVTLESIGEGVITTDTASNITYMNPAAEILTGTRFENMQNQSIHKALRIRYANSDAITEYPVEKVVQDKNNLSHDPHLTLVKADNTELVIKDTASPIMDRTGNVIGIALIFHDFSNVKHMSDKLAYQASHDDLTDLYNRREFERQLKDALKDACDRDTEHTLCYIDLDQFKIINDTCGHLAGDILLKQISHQIKNRIRRHDLLARLGGDEFGIIFYDTPVSEAKSLAEQIKGAVADFKYIWHDSSFDIGISIGLAPINASINSHSELLMLADSACYIAKDKGRNAIHAYSPSDKDFIPRNTELQWYNKITDALDADDFFLFCQEIQPSSPPEGEKSGHYEILLRLRSEDKTVLAEEFIPAAERYLLMPRIDRWVVDTFLSCFEDKAIDNFGGNHYNINLSGQSLCDDEFLDYTIQRLQGRYVNPAVLTFEITETAAISNLDKALHFINTLKKLGCRFALDDFGTGVSSFQYLHDLPIDYIKIDGKFVRNVDNNDINHSIVNAITDIGHELGLEIIAEYVEDETIREKLKNCNIDYIQGFAVGKPFPLDKVGSRQ
ncbi:EAL domain-containing protein [Thiohalophilus sp.]|uniref:EAL domain-containing protein n=1 Tax=Thiohalophilus sp. TaxID=3028392 RepID=UPI002ACDD2AE|nr:EAL domain-containing protein [Thiohalophilus sp.]MDZ7662856.1 EAL domain-containing protein [Thiohalophilus sp.]